MKIKKPSATFVKVVLPILIIVLLAVMVWVHRATIRQGIYTDYGLDPYFEGGRGCCINCEKVKK